MEDTNPEMVASPLSQVTGKSKLDTLSKEDLIKFAKKQIVAMQKMKSKCADLEKEVTALKVPADDTVIQELNERLNAVLLEKAETHQSLTSLHKEHEELKSQAQEMKESLTVLHEELQIKNKEHADLQSHTAELTANFQMTCNQYESKISQFEKELEEAKQQLTAEIEALKDSHQTSLTRSQQEIENLQLEMERLNKQYEDDVKDLEEQLELNAADFEKERERLLSLQEELSEQLALKEGFLQDVQEEEEDGGKAIQKDSETPKVLDFPASDDSSDEAAVLKLALEDSRSQNVMLQEELIFLTNVKLELESELKQARDEFTVEKEELEFRINELQMNRDDGETSLDKTGKRRRSSVEQHHQKVKTLQESHDEDLKESSLTSAAEGEPQEEIHHGRSLSISPNNIPTNLEDEAELFIKRYQMKEEQTEASVQALQEKLKSVFQERDDLLEKLKNAEGMSELVMDRLNMSFEDLRRENEEILSQMKHKENLLLEFKEMLKFTDRPHGKSKVAHEDDVLHVQVNDLENQLLIVTSEKEQQIKILEEDVCALRSKDEEHEETIRLLKSQVSCLSEERDGLQRNTDISQQQLSDARRRIAEILRKNSSEAEIDEASDILTLINRLLTITILEEDVCALRAKEEEHQESIRLLKSQVSCLSEERDALQKNTDISQQQLSDAHRRIAEIIRQNSSEAEVDEASDILTLINRLLTIKILEEDVCALRSKEEEHEETIRLLKSQVSCLSEERDALQKNTDISQQQLSKARRCIAEIIRQNSSEAEVDEASDILTLINRLLLTITILEEDVCALRSKEEEHQESIRLLKSQVSCLSEERDALQRNTEISQQQLSEAWRHIAEILRQNSSEAEVDEASDILTLINRLLTKVQEEKSILTQDFEERVERFTLELECTRQSAEEQTSELQEHLKDVSREKDMLKASLDDMVLDTEGLQKDLSEIQAMNEKLKAENLTLLTQVDDLSRSLEDKRHEEHQSEESEIQVNQTTELQQSLADKEALISQLREEIGHLQMYKQTSVSDEDMKALSYKIEILEKEMKEKDERMNKIKAVAVKAKKELDNSKKEVVALSEEVGMLKDERDKLSRSMKDIIHGAEDYKNVMVEYDKQTELLDKEKEKLEQAEKHNEDLTRRLQNVTQQHELLSSEREDLMVRLETLQKNITQLESCILELQKLNDGLEKQLEAERLVKEQKAKDHQSAVKDMEELHAQLNKLKHQLQQTTQELEQLRKDAQQNTLLDMEMADYEKLVKELNHKLCERDQQIEEHETKEKMQKEREQRLNEEMESLKVLLDQSEEKASKMKQLLVKTKKELGDAKQKEASQMITQSSLRGELEAHQQQLEEYKIQCSNLTADRHRLEEQLKMINDQQQRTSSSYQLRLNGLQDECTAAKAELAATVSEFESYKVRVHNVLKQQKHKSSNQSDGDAFQHERKQMDAVMEQLRSRLQETQQTLQSSTSELQQLQTEHDTLLERHNKILQESVSKEAELRERVLTLQSENVSLKSEHGQCASHLSTQIEALRSSFREQVRHLQDEHCSTVETLQQQITRLETQLFHMQKEQSCSGPALVQSRKGPVERKLIDVPQFDLQGVAREEGEGMETTEAECVSSPGTPLASLEQLLTAPDPKREPVVWQVEPSKEELTHKLNTTARSVEHLNGLLHETEATNAVLMEQITLLKSEVRRLERNHEREKSVANLEYLKNVLLQFIFLRSGSERQALLPVIHTMLQLSPDEKNKLAAIAQGEEETAGSRASGWTSYLHSWSGIR